MLIDNTYPKLLFNNNDDVWSIIRLIIDETKEANRKLGKRFNIAQSVYQQLSFFACKNIIINREYQRDITKHLYCSEVNNPAHNGCFSEQPARWVKKSFIIGNVLKSIKSETNKDNNG